MPARPRFRTLLLTAPVIAALLHTTEIAAVPAGTVVPAGRLSVRRFDQSATLLPDGRVLVAGGMEANGVYLGSTEVFDPGTGRFTPGPRMQGPRSAHAASLLPDGKVLLAGGSEEGGRPLSTAELYDPATGALSPTGGLTTPRAGAAAVVLADRRVLLIGGTGAASEYDVLSSAEIYDPATGRFIVAGNLVVARIAHAAVEMKGGRVLVVGGASGGRFPNETIEASAEIFDPATGRFSATGAMTVPRYKLGAVTLADGRVLVIGGSDNRAWRGEYSSAEIYDPRTGRFTRTGDMMHKRYKLPMAVVRLPDGRVLVAGGAERPEVFDPVSGRFEPVGGRTLDGWCFSTATLLASGRVLIAGGYGDDPGRGAFASTWLYEP